MWENILMQQKNLYKFNRNLPDFEEVKEVLVKEAERLDNLAKKDKILQFF